MAFFASAQASYVNGAHILIDGAQMKGPLDGGLHS